MKTLIVGITGTVGAAVARSVENARALVRKRQPNIEGIEQVVGSLDDRASLERALDGVDRVFFITPHAHNEAALGASFVEACENACIKRIVFSGAYHPAAWNRVAMFFVHTAIGFVGAHYKSKLAVERRVRSTADPVILLPSNFYQNDELFIEDILAGEYTHAIGQRGVNRVDVEDIALAAKRALAGEIASGAYVLVGPRSWTGDECAALWSEKLGKRVVYRESPDAFRQMDDNKASDWKKTVKILQRYGVPTKPAELAQTTAVLGRAPRRYEDWVSRCSVPEVEADGLRVGA